jgi:hypothetical protein
MTAARNGGVLSIVTAALRMNGSSSISASLRML